MLLALLKSAFHGIHLNRDVTGSVTNTSTGNINVSMTVGSSSSSNVAGIYIGGALSGTLDNQGTITVSGIGTSYTANAYGVDITTIQAAGSFNNSGTISVTGSSAAYAIRGKHQCIGRNVH